MKKTGECPKCQGTNIWCNSHFSSERGYPPKRWILVRMASSSWKPWNRKYAFKDEYVCLDCGFSETYIDRKGLETIREYGEVDR